MNTYWCGFIHLIETPTKFHKKCMVKAASECTYKKDNTIGFSCCHIYDYPLSSSGTYHTFESVKRDIEKTIDLILE
jgi:hypothetical protein